ncbi:copper chaperone PCu(A)C [Xanthomonas sp. GPE 39]|uniref:copper chaperone PCu(A)C n=1 Tax=Xanthomonas sp. GPE 39 TaxID=1583099 RepID=UPI0005F2A2A2|nr:copper chaperone PCu(A)C [Xanthomonas sp. GPE 39]
MKCRAFAYLGWLTVGLVGLSLSAPGTLVAAPADKSAACVPQWHDGWVRLPPNTAMPMAAGFGRLHNPCAQTLAVVSARSPAFAEVSLHETTLRDGVSRMREVDALPLAPGADAVLQPGGLHLMLMQPTQPLREGARLPLTFVLKDGRQVQAQLQVRAGKP